MHVGGNCIECGKPVSLLDEHYTTSGRPLCMTCAPVVLDDVFPGPKRTRRDLFAGGIFLGTAAVGTALSGGLLFLGASPRARSAGAPRQRASLGRLGIYAMVGTFAACAAIYQMTFAQFARADSAVERIVGGKRKAVVDSAAPLRALWSRRKLLAGLGALVAVAWGAAIALRPPAKVSLALAGAGASKRTPYGFDVMLGRAEGGVLRISFLGASVETYDVGSNAERPSGQAFGAKWSVTDVDVDAPSVAITVERIP